MTLVIDLLVNLVATFLSVPLLVLTGVFLHSRKLRKHYVAALISTFGLNKAEAERALREARAKDSNAGNLGSIIARGVFVSDEKAALRAYFTDLANDPERRNDLDYNALRHPHFPAFYTNLTNAFASCWILRSRYGQYRSDPETHRN